jgi:hypothetical protein
MCLLNILLTFEFIIFSQQSPSNLYFSIYLLPVFLKDFLLFQKFPTK